MKPFIAALAIALVATSAKAQLHTSCSTVGVGVNCTTTGELSPGQASSNLAPMIQAIQQRSRDRAELQQQIRVLSLTGYCDAALTAAVQNGLRKEAAKIKAECIPRAVDVPPTPVAPIAEDDRTLQKTVSAAILEGRCDDAKRLALESGRMDMAEQAVRLCTAKPAG